jgi:DNA anti-recombination protein RmuC
MAIKLTNRQKEEVATKGFVVDVLSSEMSGLETRLDEKLEQKFDKFSREFHRHVKSLTEEYQRRTNDVIENFEGNFFDLKNRVDRNENRLDRVESKVF